MATKQNTSLAILALSALLTACGGGGGGSSAPEQPIEPPAAPVLSWEARQTKIFHFSWEPVAGATHYILSEQESQGKGYAEVATIQDGQAAEHDLTVLLPEKINASYILEACNAGGCTESSPVAVAGNLAQAVGYFKASNPGEEDRFGMDIALSADGSTLAVGASGEDSAATGVNGDQTNEDGSGRGAVYIFRMRDGVWQQQAYLKSSNEFDGMESGPLVGFVDSLSLSLSADGNTLAIGAPYEDSAATGVNGDQSNMDANNSGAVYILVYGEQGWEHRAYIKASNTESLVNFGQSVSLSADGETLAVGAPLERSAATGVNGDQGNSDAVQSGAVYLFSKSSGEWRQQAYIKASNTEFRDRFGKVLALSADGQTLAVGAVWEDSLAREINGDQTDNSGDSAGAVYVFTHEESGWAQQAYLKPSNMESWDDFGDALAISADGNTLAVGAPEEDSAATGVDGDMANNDAEESGAVYVFERSADTWRQASYLKGGIAKEGYYFGDALAMSDDGSRLAVAASGVYEDDLLDPDVRESGAVYLFVREGDSWRLAHSIKASGTGSNEDYFGRAIDISADGQTLAISMPQEDSKASGINGDQTDNSLTDTGAVYLY